MTRLRRLLQLAREKFPLTWLGVAVTLLAVAAYFRFAVPRYDYALRIVALLALALVASAVLVVGLGALLTRRSLRRSQAATDPLIFEAVRGFGHALKLPARRWFPLIEVTWSWIDPDGIEVSVVRSDGVLREQVESELRARATRVTRRFVIEDGFGLASFALRHTEPRSVTIVPWAGSLDRSPVLRSLAEGDDLPHPEGIPSGDRVDMRRYVSGDPLRLALWKVFARTRVLMVRTPERAIAPSTRIAAYLVAAPGDEASAAAARVAIAGGLLGEDWVFGADGSDLPATTLEEAEVQIAASRSVHRTPQGGGAGLTTFLETVSDGEPARVVAFIPARLGPWLETVAAVLRAHRGAASAVVAVDGVTPDGGGRPRVDRLLRVAPPFEPKDETTPAAAELDRITRTLARAGIEIVAVDRGTGRPVRLGLSGPGRRAVAEPRSVA